MAPENQVNPFLKVDKAVHDKAFNDWADKPVEQIITERDKVKADLKKATDEAGPECDLSKVTSVAGNSVLDKFFRIINMHSQLSGLEAAVTKQNDNSRLADDINNNRTRPTPATPEVRDQGRYDILSSSVQRHLRDTNGTLRHAKNQAVVIETDLPGNDILNTLFTRTGGWDPFAPRRPGWVPSNQIPIQVTDIIPVFLTSYNAIKYMEETTYTNAAVEIAEAAEAPEAVLALTERSVPIEKIAVSIPVTEEALEDESQVARYLDNRLMFMLRQRLDGQILNGNGTAPNIQGITTKVGVSDQDWAANFAKPLNTLLTAQTLAEGNGMYMPSHYVLDKTLWDTIRMQESTAGGYYIGNPQENFTDRIWGLPVVRTHRLSSDDTSGTVGGLIGDFNNQTALHLRRDFVTEFGWTDKDFLKGVMRIRGTVRCALEVTSLKAFATLTRP